MHTICIPQNDATVINDNIIYNREIYFVYNVHNGW